MIELEREQFQHVARGRRPFLFHRLEIRLNAVGYVADLARGRTVHVEAETIPRWLWA